MAHKTLVSGTSYDVPGGKTLVDGTAYSIKSGRTLVGGTGYDISFSPYDPVFANNSWDLIIQACQNNEVPDAWAVGDYKTMTITASDCVTAGDYGIEIIGKHQDTYADGSGTAPLTLMFKNLTGVLTRSSAIWSENSLRNNMSDILVTIPIEVRSAIQTVTKTQRGYSYSTGSERTETTSDGVFLLSAKEFGVGSYAEGGWTYDRFQQDSDRVRTDLSGTALHHWTRTGYLNSNQVLYAYLITRGGYSSATTSNSTAYMCPAFCLGYSDIELLCSFNVYWEYDSVTSYYKFTSGMTWEEFIWSDYNVDGFTFNDAGNLCAFGGAHITNNDAVIKKTNTIIDGHTYSS